jgi:MoxR-like ATPase
VEQEGTYPLPEAQTDRFLFKLLLDYPDQDDELEMIRRWGSATRTPEIASVSSGPALLALRATLDDVYVAPEIEAYILALVRETRRRAAKTVDGMRLLSFGASPRASLALYQAGRGLALLRGQEHVSPALVQEIAPDILRHRIGLSYEAEASGITPDAVVANTLAAVVIPG